LLVSIAINSCCWLPTPKLSVCYLPIMLWVYLQSFLQLLESPGGLLAHKPILIIKHVTESRDGLPTAYLAQGSSNSRLHILAIVTESFNQSGHEWLQSLLVPEHLRPCSHRRATTEGLVCIPALTLQGVQLPAHHLSFPE